MTGTLRIGVMACANIAQKSVIPAILSCGFTDLVAVASRSSQKAQQFAAQFECEAVTGYENLLSRDDIDAIYMPLPTGLHEEWVTKSLEAGKHVLVEKSFASDYPSARLMVDLARRSNLLVMENFMFLYHSQYDFVKDQFEKGAIGELRNFRSSFGFPPMQQENFRYDKALGGGALLDAGAYTLRACQLFLGFDLDVEAATLLTPEDAGVDIFGGAYLASASGSFAQVSFGFDNFYQCNCELWGSKGKLIVHRAFTAGPEFRPTISIEKQGESLDHLMEPDNHFVNLLEEFARCIRSGDFAGKYQEIENQARLMDQLKQHASA
jgi:NDP-hexose-3-ketoreductase